MVRLMWVVGLLTLLFQGICFSQEIIGTTEDGRKVVLKQDGTYRFVEPEKVVNSGQVSYAKPQKSSAVFKPKGDRFLIWYDPSIWREKKSSDSNKSGFEHKDGDIGAMVLAERIQMSLEALKQLAIRNARQAAPNSRVILEESRIVNGKSLLCMKIQGTTQGVEFIFLGYYYAGKSGVVQHLTYAPVNLFSEYEQDMNDFLNGLVINE